MIEVQKSRINRKFCSKSCACTFANKTSRADIQRDKFRSNLELRLRLKVIGRKGGFGKKGLTFSGTRYESSLEKACFEFLESSKIEFIPHPDIPNTSKISDVYIPTIDLWIELDGINREKKKKWLQKEYENWCEKLRLYEIQNLKYQVVHSIADFESLIQGYGIVGNTVPCECSQRNKSKI